MFKFLPALLLAASAFAGTAAANINGSVDTAWAGVEAGRARVAFNIGGNGYDVPMATRVLADGRLVTVGVASFSVNQRYIAVAVRKADGTADTSVAPNGRYTVPITGVLFATRAAAIEPDGSFYVVGQAPDQQQLRIWHHTLAGAEIAAPTDIGTANSVFDATFAMLDPSNRLMIAGNRKPVGSTDANYDGFVTRLSAGTSTLDSLFGGLRSITFDNSLRDDIVSIAMVGENYALCGRVGDLADSANLRFGIALVARGGTLMNSFNGNGMLVDQLSLNGTAAESACNDIASVKVGTQQRIVITGRASASGQSSRAYLLAVDLSGQLVAGTPTMIDFGFPGSATNGFPLILGGSNAADSAQIYLVGSGYYDASGKRSIAVARMNTLGSYDTTWGDSGTGTRIIMSAPAIGGSQRDLNPQRVIMAQGRLHLAGSLILDNGDTDFALIRLSGDVIFSDRFE